MHVYHLPLLSEPNIAHAVIGHFSGDSNQEIAVTRSTHDLELLRVDAHTGKLSSLCRVDTFGVIRSLAAFKLDGTTKDYLVLGTDSGRLVVLQYDPQRRRFEKIVQESFGKTGCNRAIAGQYVVCDPRGRAIMIAAVEKQKLVYLVNRNQDGKPQVSSPLEANKSNTITFAISALDTGYDNPMFVAIESDYSEADLPQGEPVTKSLVFYEVDLGLNHVVRKLSTEIPFTSHGLFSRNPTFRLFLARFTFFLVPGDREGVGGCLVFAEDHILWIHPLLLNEPVRVNLPTQQNLPVATFVINAAILSSKTHMFVLLQYENGDLMKLDFESSPESRVPVNMSLRYFDSICPSRSLCLLKSGFLFAASQVGSSYLFQITSLGEEAPILNQKTSEPQTYNSSQLKHLYPVSTLPCNAPVSDGKVIHIPGETYPEFITITAAGPYSRLNRTRFGLDPAEVALTELPAKPTGLWSLKEDINSQIHSTLVVSFTNATAILCIGEEIEEVTESGFLSSTRTLHIGQLADSSRIQVTRSLVRHIRRDGTHSDWKVSGGRAILNAVSNTRQLILVLDTNSLVTFILDHSGSLIELGVRKQIGQSVRHLALEPVSSGRIRSQYLALGCDDSTLRLYQFQSDEESWQDSALQILPASSSDLLFHRPLLCTAHVDDVAPLILHVGLQNGLYFQYKLDEKRSEFLPYPLLRYLGPAPIEFARISTSSTNLSIDPYGSFSQTLAIYIQCSDGHDWIGRFSSSTAQFSLNPIVTSPNGTGPRLITDYMSEQTGMIPGYIRVQGNELRIMTVESLLQDNERNFAGLKIVTLQALPLQMAIPRKLLVKDNLVAVIGSAGSWGVNNTHNTIRNDTLKSELEESNSMLIDDIETEEIDEQKRIFVPTSRQSCIQFFQFQNSIAELTELNISYQNDETLFCGSFVQFHDKKDASYLIVGLAKDYDPLGRTYSVSFIDTYILQEKSKENVHDHLADSRDTLRHKWNLVHRTDVTDIGIPLSLASYHGRLLVGFSSKNPMKENDTHGTSSAATVSTNEHPSVSNRSPVHSHGAALRLYDMGKKKLLLKCHVSIANNSGIMQIHLPSSTCSYRILVSDAKDSHTMLTYRPLENVFLLMADDPIQRHVTASHLLDYDSVIFGDKFGGLSCLRLGKSLSHELDYDETGAKLLSTGSGHLGGAPYKFDSVLQLYIGDNIVSFDSLNVISNMNSDSQAINAPIFYFTMGGTIGLVSPFDSRSSLLYFQKWQELVLDNLKPEHASLSVHTTENAKSSVLNIHNNTLMNNSRNNVKLNNYISGVLSGHEFPLKYLSSYFPIQNCIDGRLVHLFFSLPHSAQLSIATSLTQTYSKENEASNSIANKSTSDDAMMNEPSNSLLDWFNTVRRLSDWEAAALKIP